MPGLLKQEVPKLDNWGLEADSTIQRETQINDEGREFVNIPTKSSQKCHVLWVPCLGRWVPSALVAATGYVVRLADVRFGR